MACGTAGVGTAKQVCWHNRCWHSQTGVACWHVELEVFWNKVNVILLLKVYFWGIRSARARGRVGAINQFHVHAQRGHARRGAPADDTVGAAPGTAPTSEHMDDEGPKVPAPPFLPAGGSGSREADPGLLERLQSSKTTSNCELSYRLPCAPAATSTASTSRAENWRRSTFVAPECGAKLDQINLAGADLRGRHAHSSHAGLQPDEQSAACAFPLVHLRPKFKSATLGRLAAICIFWRANFFKGYCRTKLWKRAPYAAYRGHSTR